MMPFAGGVESLSNGTLLMSVAAAALYLPMQSREPSLRRTFAKTAAVALLAVLAFLEGGPLLLILALVLCAAGDAFLAQDGERAFLAGLASFLAGHVAFIALFATLGDAAAITGTWWRIALAAAVVVFGAAMARLLLARVGGSMRVPVAAYLSVILVMGVSSLATAPVLIVAALLFITSDTILAAQKFLLPPASAYHDWAGPSVWILYYLAQLGFTLGLLL